MSGIKHLCVIFVLLAITGELRAAVVLGLSNPPTDINITTSTPAGDTASNSGDWTGQVTVTGGAGSTAYLNTIAAGANLGATAYAYTTNNNGGSDTLTATLYATVVAPAGSTLSFTYADSWDGGNGNGDAGGAATVKVVGPGQNQTWGLSGSSFSTVLSDAGSYTITIGIAPWASTFSPPYGANGDYAESAVTLHVTDFQLLSVPEPSALTVLGIAALGGLAYAWRARRQRAKAYVSFFNSGVTSRPHFQGRCVMRRPYWSVLAVLFAIGVWTSPAAAITYTTLDDPLGVNGTYASGNGGTNIVGYYLDSPGSQHGFLYNGSTYATLDDPLAAPDIQLHYYTWASGVSGNNVIGSYDGGSSETPYGFLYNVSTQTYATLSDPLGAKGTNAIGIDGSNIVGSYEDSSYNHHGFLYNVATQTYTTLNDPLGRATYAHGISGGNIVGLYEDSSGRDHGFLYNISTQIYTTIDDPLGAGSDNAAEGIDGGNIVGVYGGSPSHGFLFNLSTQTYTTLDDPLGTTSTAHGISGGNVVGWYEDSSFKVHGFKAFVPEPASLTLLVSALLGLAGVVYLQRHRAKACVSFFNSGLTSRPQLQGRCAMRRLSTSLVGVTKLVLVMFGVGIKRSAMAAVDNILPSPVAGEGPGVRAGSNSLVTRLLLLAALCLAGPLPPARAVITSTGDVEPDPTTWTSSTTGYIANTADGTLTVDSTDANSNLLSASGYIGYTSGTTGVATVTGTSSMWTNSGDVDVGESGIGILNITGGGAVSNTDATIGYNSGSTGTVNVAGTGSMWNNSSNLFVGISGNGTLNITGGGVVNNGLGYIGYSSGTTGAVTVTGTSSTWTNSGDLHVGEYGSGTLNLTGGGAVSNFNGLIGDGSGSTGAVTVDGTNSTWTNNAGLSVGNSGNGTLNITGGGAVRSAGGFIGSNSGSTGTVTVAGTGSKWTNSASLAVGSAYRGTLNITGGGAVSNTDGYIGLDSGATGVVTVDGTNSTWTNNAGLYVGNSGNGTLNVTGGGAVSNADGYVGGGSGSTGTVTVAGTGSKWTNSGQLVVGGSSGTLNISGGGTVSNADGNIGDGLGSTGTANVAGTGSMWTNSGDLYVGYFGSGTLNITGGGAVSNITGYITYYSGSTGTVNVAGIGSKWTNSGGLLVGNIASGTLNVTGGGVVSDNGGSIGGTAGTVNVAGTGSTWTNSGELTVGGSTGTLNITGGGAVTNTDCEIDGTGGTVNVAGAGSKWTNSGALYVGYNFTSTLNVTGGGAVSNTFGYIGFNTGSTGIAMVDGAGSKWTNSNALYIGDSGNGTLNVTGNGAVSNNNGYIGFNTGSTGVAMVDGAGSKWTNNDALYVGKNGKGTLYITGGGSVTAKSVSIKSNSLLAIDTGNRSLLKINGGSGTITNNGVVRFLAGADPAAGSTYKPIVATTWNGSGTYQALGGTWNKSSHVFTVSDVQRVVSGRSVTINLLSHQRVLTADSTTGRDVGASFLASTASKSLTFKATAMGNGALMTSLKTAAGGEPVLGGWQFSATGYTSGTPAYLSFDIGSGYSRDDLEIWHYSGTNWSPYNASDLSYNRDYANFTVTGFGDYAITDPPETPTMKDGSLGSLPQSSSTLPNRTLALLPQLTVTSVPEPSTFALLLAAGLALLAYAWQRRQREGMTHPTLSGSEMFGKAIVRGLLAVVVVSCVVVAQADVFNMGPGLTSLETVWVTDPGNAADSTGCGAVGYSYRMGKYDVTAAQYAEFLNAKAKTDTYGLYNTAMADPTGYWGCNIQRSGTSGSYAYSVASDWANRPVNYVSWYDCIRFANWLQNGQGSGSTETGGTYEITGGGVNSGTVSIPSAATRATWTAANPHWVLPSEDEWYKAAYYDPNKPGGAGYWAYPTKSNTAPSNVGSDGYTDPGNHANFYNNGYTIGSPYYRTIVGEFENSASAYGTFDQGGNVWQWNETDIYGDGSSRGFRGGSFYDSSDALLSSARGTSRPANEYITAGFRVANVPEPRSITMLLGLALTTLLHYWRKHA